MIDEIGEGARLLDRISRTKAEAVNCTDAKELREPRHDRKPALSAREESGSVYQQERGSFPGLVVTRLPVRHLRELLPYGCVGHPGFLSSAPVPTLMTAQRTANLPSCTLLPWSCLPHSKDVRPRRAQR